jgi:lipopolysaccharide transport protein LptA
MREAGELAVGAVHHMPGDHEGEADDRKAKVRIAIIGKGRKNAEQHARNGHDIRRNAQPRKKWHEPARQRMDEVEVSDLLDFRRSPDRLSARARRLFCDRAVSEGISSGGLLLRHLGSRMPAGSWLMYTRRAVLPACLVAALVAGGSLIAGAAVAQRPTTSREPIVINSVLSNIDYETNTAEFTDIVIFQGDTRLTAERASTTGVGFTNSQWTFVGRVAIISERHGWLRADQAILQFREGELTLVTVIGSPVDFEQRRTDSLRPAHGHADQITYDVKQDTVRLYGHAHLSDGRKEISAPVLLYNVREERLQADSPGERRGVYITISP